MQKGRLRLMLTFRRLICLLLALGLLTISAVAEMPNPTLDPNANPYDETHPELLEADQLYCTSAILIEQSTGGSHLREKCRFDHVPRFDDKDYDRAAGHPQQQP